MATAAPPLPPGFVPVPAGPPRVIEGPPREPSPQTQAQAQHDENLVARDTVEMERARVALEASQRELAAGPAAHAAETERKAAAFFVRGFGANHSYERTGVGPRSLIGQSVADSYPNLLNSLPSEIGNSPERQVSDSAQDEFIAASLRQDSGAAIPDAELERQRRIYFPMPGDGPEALEQKRMARIRALQGLVNSAGRSLRPEARAAFQRWLDLATRTPGNPAEPADPTSGPSARPVAPPGTSVVFNDEATPGIPPGGEEFSNALQAELAAGRLRTPEEIVSFGRERGFNIPADQARAAAIALRRGQNVVVNPPRFREPDTSDARGGDPTISLNINTPLGGLSVNSEQADAAVRGAADVVTVGLSDEIAAGADTLFNGGTYGANLYRQRGIDQYDEQNNFVPRLSGQVAGGFALPVGNVSNAGRLAAVGAGYGGAYGFGSGEGGAGDRLLNAVEGAAVGGAAAGGFGVAGNLARRFGGGGGPSRAAELMAAAQRQNVDVLPADVGGHTARLLTGGVRQSPIGGAMVANAAERTGAQFAERVGALAGAEGVPARQEVLGEAVEGAFDRFNRSSSAEGGSMYSSARAMAGDQRFNGERALARLDQHLAELGENPETNAPLVAGLERLRSDLARGEKSIDAIRQLRTSTRAEAQAEGLRGTDYQRRAREVLDDLSADIGAQLPPEAADEFARADRLWAERLDFIDDVESRILGPRGDRSAEKVTRSLMEMTRGDSARFGRLLDQVNPEEAGIIRGSVINEMGRPAPGQPGNFSIETWARNYRALPERTRNMLFRGQNREHANDLLTIAEGIEGTNRYRNFSNTSGAMGVNDILRLVGSTGAAYSTYGASLIGEAAMGRLLSSPRVARLIARPPATRGRLLRRLSTIAAREPALQPDIAPIQQILEGGARSAAAEETENPR